MRCMAQGQQGWPLTCRFMLRNRSSCSAARAACILSSNPRAAVCILVAACWPPATCAAARAHHTSKGNSPKSLGRHAYLTLTLRARNGRK